MVLTTKMGLCNSPVLLYVKKDTGPLTSEGI